MKYLILTVIAAVALQSGMKSQSLPTFSFYVAQTAQPSANKLDTIWGKKFVIQLSDTLDIEKVHLKMGTSNGGSEIFQHALLFDSNANLPGGFYFNRNGSVVEINAGGYSHGFYYYEVRIEDDSSNVSQAQSWNAAQ